MENVILTISIEDDLYERLCAMAERNSLTVAEQHMALLRQELDGPLWELHERIYADLEEPH